VIDSLGASESSNTMTKKRRVDGGGAGAAAAAAGAGAEASASCGSEVLVEVCCDCVSSCRAAAQAGAGRIELCSALVDGGVTPSAGLIAAAVAAAGPAVPVVVLVRPRGGDFVYDSDEVEVMVRDIASAASHGGKGVVIGALDRDGAPDIPPLKKLKTAAADVGLGCTFHRCRRRPPRHCVPECACVSREGRVKTCMRLHMLAPSCLVSRSSLLCLCRAIDMARDPLEVLEVCKSLGFERILTSGCSATAVRSI